MNSTRNTSIYRTLHVFVWSAYHKIGISFASSGRFVNDRRMCVSDQYLYQDNHPAILPVVDNADDYVS
jgi:hypothetical protein